MRPKKILKVNGKNQYGLSLILLVFLIGMISAGLVVKFLPFSNFGVQVNLNTNQALSEAKTAVVGSVVGGFIGSNPGQFPCSENIPSIGTVNEGQAASNCSNTAVSIGRFAWRTMGIGDLRDGNTDNLWYALSPNFRVTPINSDSQASLNLDGIQNQAIAILFSPGVALAGQSRPTPTATMGPNVANYLDGENSNGDNIFISGQTTPAYNDKLIAIKPDDIFPLLEKRVLGEIKSYLIAYKAVWGSYPYPAPFQNPASATYIGSTTVSGGFLPINDAGLKWTGATCSSIRVSNGSTVTGSVSVASDGSSLTCTLGSQNYSGARAITLTGNLDKVALGFYQKMDINSITDFSITPAAIKTNASLTYSLNSSGGGTINLVANPSSNAATYTITFKHTPDHDDWNITAAISNYIYKNNWYNLIYYRVADPFLPGGNGTCGVCITVNKIINQPPNTVIQNNVHALLMSAGRKLITTDLMPAPTYGSSNPAQARPGSLLTDYFDSINNTSISSTYYDSKQLPEKTFNDQVLVIE